MKNKIKSIITLTLVFIMCFSFMSTSFAANEPVNPSVEELQKSVVYIETVYEQRGSNQGYVVTTTASGTGFAIGIPGEPVQYIATCNHVVSAPNGVYSLVFDKDTKKMIDFTMMAEGTEYPSRWIDSDGNIVYTDYYECNLVSATAIYSASTGDYAAINVVNADEGTDVAICKIASDPTDKLVARPLTTHENVNVGDAVYAIGYPGVARPFNDEAKYDYSDSTVTKGIISKSQLTYGIFNKDKQFDSYQIDAQISNGNSGGPLFLEDGSIIGINAFGYTSGADKANYSIAIDELIKLLEVSKIPYVLSTDVEPDSNNLALIIGAVAAVIVIAAIVIVIIALKNKKAAAPVVKTEAVAPAAVKTEAINQAVAKKCYLLGVNGTFAGKKFAIDDRAVFGRDSRQCNVAFPEAQPGVSSVHCELVRSGSVITLKDCNSTYGTFLKDGTKLTPNVPVVLNSGDKFFIGDKSNEFEVRY